MGLTYAFGAAASLGGLLLLWHEWLNYRDRIGQIADDRQWYTNQHEYIKDER